MAPVQRNIEKALSLGIWLEVTTLLIPGLNDMESELRPLAAWLASLSKDLPWHVSRFFPRHLQAGIPPTPAGSLKRARDIGLAEGLRHVYIGNLPGEALADTVCHSCGGLLIRRYGQLVKSDRIRRQGGECPDCGAAVAGRWGEPPEWDDLGL